jgi:metal-responsive CopG/Arc/MetJ family transcriptional regulator
MRTKKKISVTISAEMFEAIEDAAKICNMAKSQLTEEALRLWFKKRTEESMAAGYIEMAREDREFADTTFHSQKEILS